MSDQEIDEFITTIRAQAQADQRYDLVGDKARIKLLIQINAVLGDDKEWRVPMLQAITGLPIRSSYHLTHHYTCVLIDATVEGKADGTLRRILAIIKANAESPTPVPTASLFVYQPSSDLPGLFQTN